jgi:DNA-binding LytR/AlgR family response regulator
VAALQIHALVVTSDEKSRAELKKGLAHAGVKFVHELTDWAQARPLVKKRAADVVFADSLVGKGRTLDWVDEVPRSVAVVLLADNARLAVQAFEKRVLDYLVRPVAPHRLKLTLERLAEWKALHTRHGRKARAEKKIVIHSRRESAVIRPHTVVCIRAEGNYTRLTLQGGEGKLVHRSLRQWIKLLTEEPFFQIHRSTLINLDRVKYLERKEDGSRFLHLLDHAEPLPVSRRHAVQLRHRLKAFRQG